MADLKINYKNGDIAIGEPGAYHVYQPGQYKYNAKTNQYAVEAEGGWEIHDAGPRAPIDQDKLLHLSPGTVEREGVERDHLMPDNRTPLNRFGELLKGFGREAVNTMALGGGDELKALADTVVALPGMSAGTSPTDELLRNIDTQRRLRGEFEITDPKTAMAAKIGGTLLNPLNLVGGEFIQGAKTIPAAMGRGAAVGGGFGATAGALSTDGGIPERAQGAAIGAGIGAGVGGALPILGALTGPKVSPEIQLLINKGVTPTPGQMIGGAVSRIEEKLSGLPIAGDMMAAGRRRAQGEFNVAVGNDVLAPIGKKTTAEPGRALISDVEKKISDEYDALLPKITFVQDAQLTNDVAALQARAAALPETEAQQFQRIIDDIDKKLAGGVTLSGEEYKVVEAELGKLKAQFGKDPSAYVNQLGEIVGDLQQVFRDSLPRTNPMYAAPLQNANAAWAKFKRLQRAATYVGGKEGDPGVFSADQFQSAVKALDSSKDKGSFARGGANMQGLSDAAKKVLGSKVPDSGTPGRIAAMIAGTGGLGLWEPTTLAATAALSVPYIKPVQELIAKALLNSRKIGNAFPRLTQPSGNVAGQIGGTIATPQVGR